jgi:predicted ATPase
MSQLQSIIRTHFELRIVTIVKIVRLGKYSNPNKLIFQLNELQKYVNIYSNSKIYLVSCKCI